MKRLSAKTFKGLARTRRQQAGFGPESRPVGVIPHERVPDMSQVDPNLMGAAGLEPARDQTGDGLSVGSTVTLDNLPMGHGLAAALAHRHLVPGMRMPVDRLVDGAARPVGRSPDEGEITARERSGPAMVGKLAAQRLVGMVGLGDHHQPGRILVETVHDARPTHAANTRKGRSAMGYER